MLTPGYISRIGKLSFIRSFPLQFGWFLRARLRVRSSFCRPRLRPPLTQPAAPPSAVPVPTSGAPLSPGCAVSHAARVLSLRRADAVAASTEPVFANSALSVLLGLSLLAGFPLADRLCFTGSSAWTLGLRAASPDCANAVATGHSWLSGNLSVASPSSGVRTV